MLSDDTGVGFASRALEIHVGGLLGLNQGIVSNSSSTAAVTAEDHKTSSVLKEMAGGLIGKNTGALVENSSAAGNVSISGGEGSADIMHYLGGLIGYQGSGEIRDSHYKFGRVANGFDTNAGGGSYISLGGLVGYNAYGSISGSSSSGTAVTAVVSSGSPGIDAGGLVGKNNLGSITGSSSDIAVIINAGSASIHAGGLVGSNIGSNTISIFNSSSNSTVQVISNSGGDIGGLIGYNRTTTIKQSHATGSVSARAKTGPVGLNMGGLVGNNSLGAIEASDSSSTVIDTSASLSGSNDSSAIGGLAGYNAGSIKNSLALAPGR